MSEYKKKDGQRKAKCKGVSFQHGLVNSKNSILLPLGYSSDYYFVSDFWTTTRYPKTRHGLLCAKKHVAEDKKISESMREKK